MNPPPGIQKFLKDSNVNVSVSPSPNSQNNLLAKELENILVAKNNYDKFTKMPPQDVKNMVVSKLNPGMFNIVVNGAFGAQPRVNLTSILEKQPMESTSAPGFSIDIEEIIGVYGQFKRGYSHSREYGIKGNISLPFFAVEFKGQVSNGPEKKGISFTIYKNGKIRFSGGFVGSDDIVNQPDIVRRHIVDNYTSREQFLYAPLEYNNVSGQFKVNGAINLVRAVQEIPGAGSYEPEITPFLYKTYEGYKFNITKSGNVQIVGAKTPSEMLAAYQKGSEMMQKMFTLGIISGLEAVRPQFAKMPVMVRRVVGAPGVPAMISDQKQCARMSKAVLVDIAKKMGVVGIKPRDTKEKICLMISKVAKIRAVNNMKLYTKGDHFMVGRKRCLAYKKKNISNVATKAGVQVNSKNTVKKICNKLEKPKPRPKTPSPVVKAPPRISSPQLLADITKMLGKKMKPLNDNVARMRNELNRRLANVPKNKTGAPKKVFVTAAKKNIVGEWKKMRTLKTVKRK